MTSYANVVWFYLTVNGLVSLGSLSYGWINWLTLSVFFVVKLFVLVWGKAFLSSSNASLLEYAVWGMYLGISCINGSLASGMYLFINISTFILSFYFLCSLILCPMFGLLGLLVYCYILSFLISGWAFLGNNPPLVIYENHFNVNLFILAIDNLLLTSSSINLGLGSTSSWVYTYYTTSVHSSIVSILLVFWYYFIEKLSTITNLNSMQSSILYSNYTPSGVRSDGGDHSGLLSPVSS